jgi:hypothetical protein
MGLPGRRPAAINGGGPGLGAGGRPATADNSAYARQRIRLRYFKARFPDVPPPSEASRDPTALIRAARLYFEDGEAGQATELLQVAAEFMPDQIRLLLAKLEIHYLRRDGAGFLETARLIAERFPGSALWTDVARLGRRLVPGEPLFADPAVAATGPDAPWEETRNWIEAPGDFSADVLAVDFRQRVLSLSPFTEPEKKWR